MITWPTVMGPKKRVKKNSFEASAWACQQLVCGVDEVGRGCLAGPVVAGAVILPVNKISPLLKDSKMLTPEERMKAFSWINRHAVWGVGIMHHRTIDAINIYRANQKAMRRAIVQAISRASIMPSAILIDAVPINGASVGISNLPVFHYCKGETWSSSIAAASIVAKVTRDRLIMNMGVHIPGYHFELHKGYATPIHKKMIANRFASIVHRETFLHGDVEIADDEQFQLSICGDNE